MHYDVPFISNTDDDLHCFQSAYLMILKFFKPDWNISWDEWSSITGYEEGKGTWATAGLLWFNNHGFETEHVSLFDYNDFTKNGAEYLKREYGDQVGSWQVKHSNIPLEQERAELLIKSNIWHFREPTQKDITVYLERGYLVRCLVNSNKLNNRNGYIGHSIIVSGYNERGFIIQDPGLPPLKDRLVAFEEFEDAWADPNKEAKELDAIKLIA